MPDVQINTEMVTQDMFPGAYIEAKWSRISMIKAAPFYAMRLFLSNGHTVNPRGNPEYVSFIFEGNEYVLHHENFAYVIALRNLLVSDFLMPKGYAGFHGPVRYHPDLIIEGLRFLVDQAVQLFDIPLDKTRMLWILPDHGPCGFYRSRKPASYMASIDKFYVEQNEFANYATTGWFDAFIMHRWPHQQWLAIFQNLKASNKTLIYEFDDDIFNIPEWNYNSKKVRAEDTKRASIAIEMADIIVASTEQLIEVGGRPDVSYVGPNLIDINDIGDTLLCNRKLQEEYVGYSPRENNQKKIHYVHKKNKPITKLDADTYEPIRILWTGSNTHDKDVEQIIKPVRRLGEELGIAIRFIFFGYCPSEFAEMQVGQGNTNQKIVVKDKYSHFMTYIPPVANREFYSAIRTLDPDFAICPLVNDPFNLSKSNLKVIELGAFGIPCIASNFGPYKFIDDQIDGLKVFENDWYEVIKYLIYNRDFRVCLSGNIRQRVIEEFSWNMDSENRRKWDTIFNRVHELVTEKRSDLIAQIEID